MTSNYGNMDYDIPRSGAATRLRAGRVTRRIEAARFGQTTRNYHRDQLIQQVAFVILLVLAGLGALLLAFG